MKMLKVFPGILAMLLAIAPAFAQTSPTSPQTKPGQSAAAPKQSGKSTSQQTAANPMVNLNSASAEELDKLPGIGKARADAIIKNRPYKASNDLVSRHIIPQNVYDGLKDKVTVK